MVQKMPPEATPRKRPLRPKQTAALVANPATISDLTCHVHGLEARQFRELVAREEIPHVRIGRRLVVRTEAFLAALERLETAPPASGVELLDDDEDDQPTSADAVLASLGRVRR